jgi:outer membrane immunogenic protein
MFKKMIFVGSALCGIPGLAYAADLPASYQRPLKAVPPVPFTWTGFYIGANVGGAFDNSDRADASGFGPLLGGLDAFSVRQKSAGITAGGQVGYNYEFGIGNGSGIVVGIEADGAFTDLSKNSAINIAGEYSVGYHTSLDYLGTIRGRLGYAYDRFMVYGTGGFAYGGVGHNANVVASGLPPFSINFNTTETGFVYGGGVEYALPMDWFYRVSNTSAVTIRGEYLRYELSNNGVSVNVAGLLAPQIKFRDSGNMARLGVGYKF